MEALKNPVYFCFTLAEIVGGAESQRRSSPRVQTGGEGSDWGSYAKMTPFFLGKGPLKKREMNHMNQPSIFRKQTLVFRGVMSKSWSILPGVEHILASRFVQKSFFRRNMQPKFMKKQTSQQKSTHFNVTWCHTIIEYSESKKFHLKGAPCLEVFDEYMEDLDGVAWQYFHALHFQTAWHKFASNIILWCENLFWYFFWKVYQ